MACLTFTAHNGCVHYHNAPIPPQSVTQLLKLFDREGLDSKATELRCAREDAAFQRLKGWARDAAEQGEAA